MSERRVFRGRPCNVFGQRAFNNGGPTPIGLLTMLCGLDGKRVRITVEVLDEPAGDDRTGCASAHAPKEG